MVWRSTAILLTVVLFSFSAMTSRQAVQRVLRTGGDGFFSTAIFDLWDFIVDNDVNESELLQVQWGSYAQFYFLSKGEYVSPGVVFDVLGAPDEETQVSVVAAAVEELGGTVLVPVYTEVSPPAGVDVTRLLEEVADVEDGSVCTAAVFSDRALGEEIRLYRLSLEGDPPGESDAGAACIPDV